MFATRMCTVLAAIFLLVLTHSFGANAQSKTNQLNLRSGWGITVHNSAWTTNRTAVIGISTDAIDDYAINGPHEIRVTLPENYDNSNTRFPVLYLLHGGAGGSSRQWTSEGAAEHITRNASLITVMPEGGKVGWYTNWVNRSVRSQEWETFHLKQLIPWIDENFRTIAKKRGRAIAGLSMGGFGAIHYAQQRPDLFAFAASFSGALDLEESRTRAAITGELLRNSLPSDGPFGRPYWPMDRTWAAKNPLNHVNALRGVAVALYAGDGAHDHDTIERTVGWSTFQFHNALNAAGINHFYWMYGRPGPGTPWNCDGGHNFNCWNMAFEHALPRILDALERP